jgi:hypothetical protein
MSLEHDIHLQFDMFSGELVDNRTRKQKKADKQRQQPTQTEMFSQREIAQFGVNPRPLMPLSPNTKLLLIPEDPRSEEEVAADRQRAAEEQTFQLFPEPEPRSPEIDASTGKADIVPDTQTLALVVRGVVALMVIEQQ